MVNDIVELVHELESIRCEVSFAGQELDLDQFDFQRFEQLLDCIPRFENQLTLDIAKRIESVVDSVLPIFEQHYQRVADEVGGIRKTRRALRGYIGTSFHTRARHIYRNI